MSVREIIHIPDPLLREVSKPVERFDDDLRALLNDMAETMYDAPGIGLAGIQIAVPRRIVVVDCTERAKREEANEGEEQNSESGLVEPIVEEHEEEEPLPRNPIFLINPQIVSFADTSSVYEEGCLSIPEYYAEVERPAACIVKYLDEFGKEQQLEAEGLLSTCLQHEVDHLDGKLFIDYLSRLKRDRVIKKFTKVKKQTGVQNAQPMMIG